MEMTVHIDGCKCPPCLYERYRYFSKELGKGMLLGDSEYMIAAWRILRLEAIEQLKMHHPFVALLDLNE